MSPERAPLKPAPSALTRTNVDVSRVTRDHFGSIPPHEDHQHNPTRHQRGHQNHLTTTWPYTGHVPCRGRSRHVARVRRHRRYTAAARTRSRSHVVHTCTTTIRLARARARAAAPPARARARADLAVTYTIGMDASHAPGTGVGRRPHAKPNSVLASSRSRP